MNPLWHALGQSIKIAVPATLGAALLAVPMGYLLARRQFPGKAALETILMMPLVLPPTVVGYFLLILMGHNGVLSGPFHFSVVWTWYGGAMASGVVAFPLLMLPARAAFAGVDKELEDVSRLMGANPFQVFWHVSLPMARTGIASGILLGFARALGEFGATMMVLGIRDQTMTLPIFVYNEFEDLNPQGLIPAVVLLTAVTLVVIVIYNKLPLNRHG